MPDPLIHDLTLDQIDTYEADAIVMSFRLEAERCRRIIEREEERLDRIELSIFRRVNFLHQSATGAIS